MVESGFNLPPPILTADELSPPSHDKSSYCLTLQNLIKGQAGAGLFTMAIVLHKAGLIIGSICIPILALVVITCYYTLLNATDVLWLKVEASLNTTNKNDLIHHRKRLQNYNDVALTIFEITSYKFFRRFKEIAKVIIEGLTFAMHLGYCMVYLVFAASTFEMLFRSIVLLPVRLWLIIICSIMTITSFIHSLNVHALISSFGNIFLLSGCIGCYFFILDFRNYDMNNISLWGTPNEYLMCVSITLFAFATITFILPLRLEMKEPSRMKGKYGIITVGFTILLIVTETLSLFSYLRYGSKIAPTIILNFKPGGAGNITRFLVVMSVISTYPINIYIPASMIWDDFCDMCNLDPEHYIWSSFFKVGLCIITLLGAMFVPYLDLCIALIGSISVSSLCLIIPPILELLIALDLKKSLRYKVHMLVKNILLASLGITVLIIGTIQASHRIYKKIKIEHAGSK